MTLYKGDKVRDNVLKLIVGVMLICSGHIYRSWVTYRPIQYLSCCDMKQDELRFQLRTLFWGTEFYSLYKIRYDVKVLLHEKKGM